LGECFESPLQCNVGAVGQQALAHHVGDEA